MVHRISLATTYLQSFVITHDGIHRLRGHATGFFVRVKGAILLLTNWHVVSGLDPANPSEQRSTAPSPHYLKANVLKGTMLSELTIPLYGSKMALLWREHPAGRAVDLAIIQLPEGLASYFNFHDIYSVEDTTEISEMVGRDVFVVGFPFSRAELQEGFGANVPHFLPVWKRGTIATEPKVRLGDRVILIDTLSRPGMSGAPVFMAHDSQEYLPKSKKAADAMRRINESGPAEIDDALQLLADADLENAKKVLVKRFKFLGIYSGTIGSTKLAEVALGKCWHADVVREAIEQARDGIMEFHAPSENEHYTKFLNRGQASILEIRDKDGNVVSRERY
ncbi:S1 family peptidase [Xanthomonas cannabis]|uniref:S1 family peptidase n=1 Tax=Xanthomonas cannabis TaxID=1885674 RepID=UPI001FB8D473|nr:serine protease [Xanthomonas cannabis]